ncbi:MAG: CO dehydrogenase/CO-methylating acetyl-CoA synthase complex subunit beta [Oscillospiraceae bacterium]|nr:CO dehydrogenase/CO-methylating acetyl-CoA synthase complex subunit beta [Oscillospiraceae bacterium]
MSLFDRVFRGADDMYAVADKDLAAAIKDLGGDAPVKFPNTAYFLSCIYGIMGKEVKNLTELKEALDMIKAKMTREQKLGDAFDNGIATALAGEVIEGVKYARTPDPYANSGCHGHMTDAEVRSLGVPLVTGDIPGFVVIVDAAPTVEEAVDLIKDYQRKGIFVFLLGSIIDQAISADLKMGADLRIVPISRDYWGVSHIISVVARAAMIFGAVQPGDWPALNDYAFHRVFAFVNAFAPLKDIVVGCGGGAIAHGFPVITNETENVWRVPKSLIVQEDISKFVDTSLEARNIKLKITNVDIPVSLSSAFEGEIIRSKAAHVDIYGARVDAFEWARMKEAHEVEDHKIVVDGPDLDTIEPGSFMALGIIVDIAGNNMQADFEPVFERKFHQYLNCIEGAMHTGQRDMIRIRISNDAYAAGFRLKHIGEVLYAKLKSDFEAIIDKCQVTLISVPEKVKELRAEANKSYDKRDERLENLTDESVDKFYNCILCQSFSPAHVCVVTPERLGLCGAVSWLDAKATYELDPNGPCRPVTKNKLVDERVGTWEDVNEAVYEHSHGNIEKVTLYSIIEDPMTSCGCFECICGIEVTSNGVAIVNREHSGVTPIGMTFSELASMTGGGVQTPGFMGHGKHFIASKKFLKAEGGIQRIVWMPKELKDTVRDRLNTTAKTLYDIDDFCAMIADETITEDAEALMTFLTEKNHPVLKMDPLEY